MVLRVCEPGDAQDLLGGGGWGRSESLNKATKSSVVEMVLQRNNALYSKALAVLHPLPPPRCGLRTDVSMALRGYGLSDCSLQEQRGASCRQYLGLCVSTCPQLLSEVVGCVSLWGLNTSFVQFFQG